jgi:hypothetical protein
MKNLFIAFLILLLIPPLCAQDRFKQYGHGILHKGGLNTFWQNEDKAFDVFDGPGGEKVGIMKYERYQLRVHWTDSSKIDEYGGYGAFDYGAEVNPYVYWYSRQEDFVLLSYPDGKKGLWLNEKQFRTWGIESASW